MVAGTEEGASRVILGGTIDQVLFGSLRSRHLALRHLALAGKVVVIDEVHAYDTYMSVYLERVLEWLAAYRVPVVLLSATLPAARRRALAAAYAGGEEAVGGLSDDAYPRVTAVAPTGAMRTACPPAARGRRTDIRLEALSDDLTELARQIETELVEGGCALVVRNTVDRVLETAERLRERFGAENVVVTHSRFLAADCARREAELLAQFGPEGNVLPGSASWWRVK